MRFSESLLRSIRDRVSIVSYAGKKLAWDRKRSNPGRGDYWACCPFHGEKSPSFHVLDERGIYKCFGCGAAGDIFTLAMKLEGLSFPEAVERIADEGGISLPKESREAPEETDRRQRLLKLMARAGQLYRDQLRSPEAHAARQYLERRGVTREVCDAYGVGFAPDGWTWAIERLTGEGFGLEDLVAAGLATPPDGRRPIDVFRNRILFEIADSQGRLVAFGGRAMDPEAKAKYLNSPETPLFSKGRMLYRLKPARELLAKTKADGLVVAEGYLDVIALDRAGIAAVAPLGTALTPDQLELIWRSGPRPTLCFDGDGAGVRAADRALDMVGPQLSPARTCAVVLLPEKQDPDDIYRTQGAEALRTLIGAAKPAVEAVFEREVRREPLDTPEARAGLRKRLKAFADTITDKDTSSQYFQDLMARASGHLRKLGETAREARAFTPWAPGTRSGAKTAAPSAELLARAAPNALEGHEGLLRFAVDTPDLLARYGDRLAGIAFADPDLDRIRHVILDMISAGQTVDRSTLSTHLQQQGDDSALARVSRWPAPKSTNEGRDPRLNDLAALREEWVAWVTLESARFEIEADLTNLRARETLDDDDEAFRIAMAAGRAKVDVDRAALLARDASAGAKPS